MIPSILFRLRIRGEVEFDVDGEPASELLTESFPTDKAVVERIIDIDGTAHQDRAEDGPVFPGRDGDEQLRRNRCAIDIRDHLPVQGDSDLAPVRWPAPPFPCNQARVVVIDLDPNLLVARNAYDRLKESRPAGVATGEIIQDRGELCGFGGSAARDPL